MRSAEQKLLNAVQRPEAYREVVVCSAGTRIVLSVWDAPGGTPVVLFLPGTMTHPLFYEEFLEVFNRIIAPHKELLILDSDVHLLFDEDLATVLPPLLERLGAVVSPERGAPP